MKWVSGSDSRKKLSGGVGKGWQGMGGIGDRNVSSKQVEERVNSEWIRRDVMGMDEEEQAVR